MTAAIREPGTEAGRRLLAAFEGDGSVPRRNVLLALINSVAAIEAEARQQGRDRGLREAGLVLQVAASEVAWRLGRDHPEFDALMLAVTRHNSALRALASADGPPEPGLDVERLARALAMSAHEVADMADDDLSGMARVLAAAYGEAGSADGPPAPGLDVERLARAMDIHVVGKDRWARNSEVFRTWMLEEAADIAMIYARLSADGDSPGGAE